MSEWAQAMGLPLLWERLTHRRALAHDPMVTLELQAQLTRLTLELWRLEGSPRTFAHAHHVRAAETAYCSTLRSAIRHAGGDDATHPPDDVVGLELDLAARGWTW